MAEEAKKESAPSDEPKSHDDKAHDEQSGDQKPRKRRHIWRGLGITLLVFAVILVAARLAMPRFVRWYVNRTIDQSPLYDGKIGDVDIHLWRGAYTIKDVRLIKTTGNVPVPLFASKQVDFSIQWDALLHGKVVGRMKTIEPELNFVDSESDSGDQTGNGGPWFKIIQDLFPFKINSAEIHRGQIHFRNPDASPPVDMYITHLEATIENLTNIRDETTPLVSTVTAHGLAMDHAKFEYEMKLDPFSYRPTFQLAVRLLGLDVTKTNNLARAYGGFDFERGFFDLVIELDAKEGHLEGYVKPLFRNLQVLSLKNELGRDNPLQLFWEAVVGVVAGVLKNQPRDQFATVIPLEGDLTNPQTSILTIVGNVLRNAFIRAYLPRLQGESKQVDWLRFKPGSVTEPVSLGEPFVVEANL